MPLPSSWNTITIYDDFIDYPAGRPILGTGTIRGHNVRRPYASGLTLVPVETPFTLSAVDGVFDGQTITAGHFEVTVPLSIDSDIDSPDTYTVTLKLQGTAPLLAGVGPFDIALDASMPARVRLSDVVNGTIPTGPPQLTVAAATTGSGSTTAAATSAFAANVYLTTYGANY